jgi:hypothetical protein
MEVLYGKPMNKIQTNYEEDLAKKNNNVTTNKSTNLKSENFRDTFQHFSDINDIGPYDNSDYSYI